MLVSTYVVMEWKDGEDGPPSASSPWRRFGYIRSYDKVSTLPRDSKSYGNDFSSLFVPLITLLEREQSYPNFEI